MVYKNKHKLVQKVAKKNCYSYLLNLAPNEVK